MAKKKDPRIVERKGEGWSYRIDGTTAPRYVVVTQRGAATAEALEATIADLSAVMEGVMGPGQRFCPFIVDLREASAEKLTIPAGEQLMRSIQRRIRRAVIILRPDDRDPVSTFLGMMSKALPDLDVVHSMEEALEKLDS